MNGHQKAIESMNAKRKADCTRKKADYRQLRKEGLCADCHEPPASVCEPCALARKLAKVVA